MTTSRVCFFIDASAGRVTMTGFLPHEVIADCVGQVVTAWLNSGRAPGCLSTDKPSTEGGPASPPLHPKAPGSDWCAKA